MTDLRRRRLVRRLHVFGLVLGVVGGLMVFVAGVGLGNPLFWVAGPVSVVWVILNYLHFRRMSVPED